MPIKHRRVNWDGKPLEEDPTIFDESTVIPGSRNWHRLKREGKLPTQQADGELPNAAWGHAPRLGG